MDIYYVSDCELQLPLAIFSYIEKINDQLNCLEYKNGYEYQLIERTDLSKNKIHLFLIKLYKVYDEQKIRDKRNDTLCVINKFLMKF